MPPWLVPEVLVARLVQLIGPLVGGLLFLIGVEFSHAMTSVSAMAYVIKIAGLLVVATTAFPCGLLVVISLLAARVQGADRQGEGESDRTIGTLLRGPVKECGIALALVGFGAGFGAWLSAEAIQVDELWLPSSSNTLLVLMILIGVDLASIRLRREILSWRTLCVPASVILGSILGGFAVHLATGEDLRVMLALSSGFGWFSLSSTLIAGLSNEVHGATALIIDLGRELVAIVLLYLFGQRQARLGIAAAGATAMDSTLPIVRQACPSEELPIALVSGFVLTLTAPFLITAILAH